MEQKNFDYLMARKEDFFYGLGSQCFFCSDGLEHFEPYKKNFKYFHDSFYFDSANQADGFLEKINVIDDKCFRNENRELFAQKLDILIQTYGIKKSVHFVYPFFSFQQSKSDNGPMVASMDHRQELAISKMMSIIAEAKYPLDYEHCIRVRLLNRARADSYLVVDYESYYQYFKNLDPFKYIINDVDRDQKIPEAPSSEKISKSIINQSVIDEEKEIDIVDGELTHSKITGSNQPVFKQHSNLIEELLYRKFNSFWIVVEGLYDKSFSKARIFGFQVQFG